MLPDEVHTCQPKHVGATSRFIYTNVISWNKSYLYVTNCKKIFNIKCFTTFFGCVYGLFLHWIVHGGSLIIASKWKIIYRLCAESTLLFYEEGTATKLL